jgi:hypothetical protein
MKDSLIGSSLVLSRLFGVLHAWTFASSKLKHDAWSLSVAAPGAADFAKCL